jgi:hypothetical protein
VRSVRAGLSRTPSVDQGVLGRQAADRLRDVRQPVGEIRAAAGPQRDALAPVSADDPVSVVLDLMQPIGARRRAGDEERLARANEPGRRGAPSTRGEIRRNVMGLRAARQERENLRRPMASP